MALGFRVGGFWGFGLLGGWGGGGRGVQGCMFHDRGLSAHERVWG